MDTSHSSDSASTGDAALPHLVLVGLPGSGKSTVGAMLATKLGRPFMDFDVEIERREGMPISQIFGERGEAAFRQMEVKVTQELKGRGNMILAPGGGWVTDAAAVSLLRPPAVMIYLRVRPETALRRLAGAVGSRPLLNRPDPLAEMNKLLEQRRAAYQGSDHEIGTELLTPEQVTAQIAALVASK
jgi:shikimate kinase